MGSGRWVIAVAAFGTALTVPAGLAAQEPAAPVLDEPVLSEPVYDPAPDETPSPEPEYAGAEQAPPVSGRQAARGATTPVTMIDYAFDPSSVEVEVGGTVTWTNEGPNEPHDATADDGSFETGEVAVGQSASVTFDDSGSFTYICSLHPSMSGTVTVRAADDTGPTGGPGDNDNGTGGTDSNATPTPDPTPTPSSSPAESTRPLPSTGQDELPLFGAAIALLVAGLLAGALSVLAKPPLSAVELADRRAEVGPE